MKVRINPKAINDLADLSRQQRNKIFDRVEELEESPTSHEDVELVDKRKYSIFRLKITEGQLNHRALFDVVDGEIKVYGFIVRDLEGYDEETLDQKVGRRR